MVEIWLPYGASEVPARIPEERLIDILRPREVNAAEDPIAQLTRLVESNSDFNEKVKKAKRICVAVGPSSNRNLPSLLTEALVHGMHSSGAQPSSIDILLISDAIEFDSNRIPGAQVTCHDPDRSPTAPVAEFNGAFPVELNTSLTNADLKILVGELKPHPFLGFSGLSDIVFPGLASRGSAKTQLTNRSGIDASTLHQERAAIPESLPDLFALGFVLDGKASTARICLGQISACLEELKGIVREICATEAQRRADIVVMSAGGKPADESLLVSVETLPAALEVLKREGVIILAAECFRGHGDTEFHEWCAEHKETRYLEARLRRNFSYDGFKAAFLKRTLESHALYLVSTIPDYYVEHVFDMKAANTVNSALRVAQRSLGSDSTITVIPDASRVITNVKAADVPPKP